VRTLLQHAGRELGSAIDSYRRVSAVHAYEDTVCTSTSTNATTDNCVVGALTAAATAVASCILSVCSSMSLWYIEPSSGSMWVVTDSNGTSNGDYNRYFKGYSNGSGGSTGTTHTHLMRIYSIELLCSVVLKYEFIVRCW
jgi:hypothetical protein